MKHTYKISGMTCNGCRTSAENTLNNIKGVVKATVHLDEEKAEIEMKKHISTKTFQEEFLKAGLHYTIDDFDANSENKPKEKPTAKPIKDGNGIFYCPMHCEGEKTYEKAGDCPVCGMDLIEQPKYTQSTQYTCPMHPEIIKDEPGSCPICGMDLIPMEPTKSEEDKTYLSLLKKMKISLFFAVPVFVISMSMHLPSNPLMKLMPQIYWDWSQFVLTLPIVFYTCWMFYVRAWKSIISWNLNMFTLVGIGTGNHNLSSMIICRLFRVNDGNYSGSAGLMEIDFHYEIDSDGSNNEYTKEN